MLNLVSENPPLYDFQTPLDPKNAVPGDTLFAELVKTRAFQRMKSIRFLGGIDYTLVPFPNGAKSNTRFTRYQHSLGVARLALRYSDIRHISFADRRLIYTAALLHDIGHAPLSHSLEPVFQELFAISHHSATKDIITGRVPLGKDVFSTLRRYGVDVDKVLALIAGDVSDFEGFFDGPINFDTIDAIFRSITYLRSCRNAPKPEAVINAVIQRSNNTDRELVDQFWSYKDIAYRHIINSRIGIIADSACQIFMRRHLRDIKKCDYYSTEDELFHKMPGLRDLLKSPSFEKDVTRQIDRPIYFKLRKFFVNASADFFARDDKGRYQQSKDICVLPSKSDDAIELNGVRTEFV